jgi:hypothetical protein
MPKAPKHNIVMYQGGSFDLSLTYQDSDGCAIDLSSGYTCEFEGRTNRSDADPPKFTFSSSGSQITLTNSTPNIAINLDPADTSAITAGVGVYDIKLTHSDSTVFLIEGEYEVVQPVTR